MTYESSPLRVLELYSGIGGMNYGLYGKPWIEF